jgi:iron-sulfur cluster assembly accessory protein
MSVNITEAARKHILAMLNELDKPILFFGLRGGGCAGFEYSWEPMDEDAYPFFGDPELDQQITLDTDHVFIVDCTITDKLTNSTIDYTRDFVGSKLTVDNPNAKGGCGCGTSISL